MGAALSSTAPLLLYDGVCPLCNGAVRFLLMADRNAHIRFAPLQGPTARAVLARHPGAAKIDSLILVLSPDSPAERLFFRSDAVLQLLPALGPGWQLFRLFGILPSSLRDALYSLIARNRYRWLGRYDTCPLPPDRHRSRFLP